jgi:hypothetical protein
LEFGEALRPAGGGPERRHLLIMPCPAGRAHYTWGGRSHAFLNLRLGLPLVGKDVDPDQREGWPKGYTHHGVVALRAGGPSGRTSSLIRSRLTIGRINRFVWLLVCRRLFRIGADGESACTESKARFRRFRRCRRR